MAIIKVAISGQQWSSVNLPDPVRPTSPAFWPPPMDALTPASARGSSGR